MKVKIQSLMLNREENISLWPHQNVSICQYKKLISFKTICVLHVFVYLYMIERDLSLLEHFRGLTAETPQSKCDAQYKFGTWQLFLKCTSACCLCSAHSPFDVDGIRLPSHRFIFPLESLGFLEVLREVGQQWKYKKPFIFRYSAAVNLRVLISATINLIVTQQRESCTLSPL